MLEEKIRKIKIRLLKMHYEAGVGHIGGNLSALDMLMVLHHKVMGADDLFVLSKGHAAGALYATLFSIGKLSEEDLTQFHKDHTKLSGHPPAAGVPGIIFATGSLGHGLPLAVGLSLGKRLQKQKGRVYCLMSDGEWEEGSNWEALIFAAHQKLDGLTCLVDCNGLQGFGTTKDVAGLDIGSLKTRFSAFGASVDEVDGHKPEDILHALNAPRDGEHVRLIVARTKKGNGVSFMENKMEWHYLTMTETQYKRALEEVARP